MKKSFCILIVTAVLSMLFFCVSHPSNAAVAPAINILGYNTQPGSAPARIAADNNGMIYVTDSNSGSVNIYSNNGVLVKTIKVGSPLGIAVDLTGRVFVGSSDDGSVSVFGGNGVFLYALGAGEREFGLPSDIAVSSSGMVYVTDSRQNLVKAYALSGEFISSFGAGLLNFPTGIAVDDAAGEVYVADHISDAIKIFDLSGTYKRYFRGSTTWRTIFTRPQGLVLDATRLYVVDSYNSSIAVYGKDGFLLSYFGNYGEGPGEFKTPLDIAIDKDNKLFITNHNNGRIEVAGIDSFTQFSVNPSSIGISVFEGGYPVTQTVNLSSVGNATDWAASTAASWLSVSLPGGTTPSDVAITADPAGLGAGNYTSYVNFTSASGTVSALLVQLEVKPQPKTLYIAPTNVSFKYQQQSTSRPSANVALTSTGGSISWTAGAGADWLSLDTTAGITPSSINLSISDAVSALAAGNYDANVIVDGGSAKNSPAAVNVSLRVIYAGTVKVISNLDEGGFEISGPSAYSGTGREWINDEVTPGEYKITFRHVSGYIRPALKTFKVETGKETAINVTYRQKPVATNIIAGSGGTKGKNVDVISLDGNIIATFEPFTAPLETKVAAGDIDGTGTDSIIVTDYKGTIKAYSADGIELSAIEMPPSYKSTVTAVGDIDGDGKADIISGSEDSRNNIKDRSRVIKLIGYEGGKLVEKDTLYTDGSTGEFSVALGDINGDGLNELLMADEKGVRAFEINLASPAKLTELWSVEGNYACVPRIAAGDINDDGIADIALSVEEAQKGKEKAGVIKMLDGSGKETGMTIEAYKDLGYVGVSRVALGDMDGDGVDEVITGAGQDEKNEPLVKIYESDCVYTGSALRANGEKNGVNVGIGRFK